MDNGAINPIATSLAATFANQPVERRAEQREIIKAVKAVNQAELYGQNSELTFVIDRDTRRPVVQIKDRQTGEVIEQIPPERVLRIAKDLMGR
jgi:flagellar protein FlaG